jgi:hypothetical protein
VFCRSVNHSLHIERIAKLGSVSNVYRFFISGKLRGNVRFILTTSTLVCAGLGDDYERRKDSPYMWIVVC